MAYDPIEACFVCDGDCSGVAFFLWVYDDLIVYSPCSEGGGRTVCERCHYLAVGYFASRPGVTSFDKEVLRKIIRSAPENEILARMAKNYGMQYQVGVDEATYVQRLLKI